MVRAHCCIIRGARLNVTAVTSSSFALISALKIADRGAGDCEAQRRGVCHHGRRRCVDHTPAGHPRPGEGTHLP
eukprot:1006709-Prorocentrum_minimum.AAC.3